MAKHKNVNKGKEAMSMSAVLRQAVLDSGQTMYRVSKGSGVPYAIVHRFVRGGRPASMEALDKLCAYLDLRLTGPTQDTNK
jgi:hypothetical protein